MCYSSSLPSEGAADLARLVKGSLSVHEDLRRIVSAYPWCCVPINRALRREAETGEPQNSLTSLAELGSTVKPRLKKKKKVGEKLRRHLILTYGLKQAHRYRFAYTQEHIHMF